MIRTLTVVVLWLVTALATTVTILAGWTATHVQSQAGFVAFASSVGNDPQAQQAAADLAGEAFADQPAVPEYLHDAVQALVTRAVIRLTESDHWDAAWRETVRRSHENFLGGPAPTSVEIDVAPLVDLAIDEITRALPIDVDPPTELLVKVGDQDPSGLLGPIANATRYALLAAGTAVIAGLLALAVARRRSTTFAMLGGAVTAGAVLGWLIARVAGARWGDRMAAPSDSARLLREVVVDRAVSSLDTAVTWVAIAGAAMAVAGLVSRAWSARA